MKSKYIQAHTHLNKVIQQTSKMLETSFQIPSIQRFFYQNS